MLLVHCFSLTDILRKIFNDSLRQKAVYAITMIIIFAQYLSATADQPSDFMDPWWYNSCDISNHPHHRRHSPDCSSNNRVEHNFHKVKNQITLLKTEYISMSSKLKKVHKFEGLFHWLPNVTLKVKPKKKIEVLVKMHENLQKYAVAVQYLMKLDVHTDASHDNDLRLRLFRGLSTRMKSTLCEIEDSLNSTCESLPPRIPPTYPDGRNLPGRMDFTDMRMADAEVMTKLHSAIINWEKLAKRLSRKRGNNDGKKKNQSKNKKTQETKKQHQNKKKSKTKS